MQDRSKLQTKLFKKSIKKIVRSLLRTFTIADWGYYFTLFYLIKIFLNFFIKAFTVKDLMSLIFILD